MICTLVQPELFRAGTLGASESPSSAADSSHGVTPAHSAPHEILAKDSAPAAHAAELKARAGFTRYGCARPPPCVGAHGSRFAHQLETLEDFSPAYLERLRRRLEAKYTPEPTSGCWLWFGATTSAGYGSIGVGSRGHGTAIVRAAHRVMYLLERGPIATDLVLDHRCRNTACINPWHLEPVTQVVNIARGRARRASLRTPEAA